VEIEQSLQSGGREFFSDEGDKGFCDRLFREVTLPENRQDGLDTRTGRLPKDVISLHLADVLVYRSINIPVGKQRLRVPIKAPALIILDEYSAEGRSRFSSSIALARMCSNAPSPEANFQASGLPQVHILETVHSPAYPNRAFIFHGLFTRTGIKILRSDVRRKRSDF